MTFGTALCQEDRPVMAEDGHHGGEDVDPHIGGEVSGEPDGCGGFENIQDGRENARQDAGCSHGVSPACAAAGDPADVFAGENLHDDQAERDGAEEITCEQYPAIDEEFHSI